MKSFFVFLAVLAAPLWMSAGSKNLTVTNIAHAGFLLTDGSKKVLIDALTIPNPVWKYESASPELRHKMETGQPPFDGIDLLLISHAHGDHFSAPLVLSFLLRNPKTMLLTTPEVRDNMKASAQDFLKVAAQVVAPEVEWKHRATREIAGIQVEISRLDHGTVEHPSVLYSFLFVLGGKKVLCATGTHGDKPEEYRESGWAKRGIGVAFLSPLMVRFDAKNQASFNRDGLQMVMELIAPASIVIAHIGPDEKAQIEKLLPQLQKECPGLVFMTKELESRAF